MHGSLSSAELPNRVLDMPAAALTGRGRPGAVSSGCLWAIAKDKLVNFSLNSFKTCGLQALSGRMLVKGGERPKVAPLVEQIRAVGSFSPGTASSIANMHGLADS